MTKAKGAYNINSTLEKYLLRHENELLLNIYHDESTG